MVCLLADMLLHNDLCATWLARGFQPLAATGAFHVICIVLHQLLYYICKYSHKIMYLYLYI